MIQMVNWEGNARNSVLEFKTMSRAKSSIKETFYIKVTLTIGPSEGVITSVKII